MFLSIFRPLNSLQISRLLDSLKVSKHFTRPLSSLFPSPGLRHVAYARPLGGVMLLMRPRGPAPGAVRRKNHENQNRSPAARGGRRHWRPAQFCFAEGRRLARLFPGPWGPRAARFSGYRQCRRPHTGVLPGSLNATLNSAP